MTASFNDETHDTFCCIARHKQKRQLVVAFRGTSSLRNWNTNSKYYQTAFNLKTLLPETQLPTSFVTPHLIIQHRKNIRKINASEINHDINRKYSIPETKISKFSDTINIIDEKKVDDIQINFNDNNNNNNVPLQILLSSSSSYSLASSTSSTSFHTAYSPPKNSRNIDNYITNINSSFVHYDSSSLEQLEYKSCDEGCSDANDIDYYKSCWFNMKHALCLLRKLIKYIITSFLGLYVYL